MATGLRRFTTTALAAIMLVAGAPTLAHATPEAPTDVTPEAPAPEVQAPGEPTPGPGTPEDAPTDLPTQLPTDGPTQSPTNPPTDGPTDLPTNEPSEQPSGDRSAAPEDPPSEPEPVDDAPGPVTETPTTEAPASEAPTTTSAPTDTAASQASPTETAPESEPLATVAAVRHELRTGERLAPNEELTSPDGRYRARLQTDGNFAVFDGARPIWMTGDQAGGGGYVVVQNDGNIGVYGSRNAWASGTGGTGDGHRLVMQDDGNLVLYTTGSAPVWSSKYGRTGITRTSLPTATRLWGNQALVSANGRYRALLQTDGNFAVYDGSRPTWWSGDTGGGGHLVVQDDGNIGVYGSRWTWASGTGGTGDGHRLVMQDDGNLVLYTVGEAPVWASKHGRTGISRTTLTRGARLWGGQALVSSNGRYRALLQTDGNFAVYDGSRPTWWSGDTGGGGYLILQGDGNIGVYGSRWTWASGTNGGTRLVQQNDGNLVLYDAGGGALWSSRHGSTQPPTPPVFTYGTLRPGESAWGRVSNDVTTTRGSRMADMSLYLSADRSFPWGVEGGSGIAGDLLYLKPASYGEVIARMDAYERYNPALPPDNQAYVRSRRTATDGTQSWVYVTGPRQAVYVRQSLPWISSGDWKRR
ncbi:gamma-glutamylcyclotransferase [Salana multivorans]